MVTTLLSPGLLVDDSLSLQVDARSAERFYTSNFANLSVDTKPI